MVDITQVLVTAAASSAGALLASVFGTWLGARKFRQERSYDARVAWHTELAQTAKEVRNRMKGFRAFQKKAPAGVDFDVVNKLADLTFKFQELAEQAPLYAKRDTCERIQRIVSDLNKLKWHDGTATQEAVSTEHGSMHAFDVSMLGLEMVFRLVARDLRVLLHLEPLAEHANLDFPIEG